MVQLTIGLVLLLSLMLGVGVACRRNEGFSLSLSVCPVYVGFHILTLHEDRALHLGWFILTLHITDIQTMREQDAELADKLAQQRYLEGHKDGYDQSLEEMFSDGWPQ